MLVQRGPGPSVLSALTALLVRMMPLHASICRSTSRAATVSRIESLVCIKFSGLTFGPGLLSFDFVAKKCPTGATQTSGCQPTTSRTQIFFLVRWRGKIHSQYMPRISRSCKLQNAPVEVVQSKHAELPAISSCRGALSRIVKDSGRSFLGGGAKASLKTKKLFVLNAIATRSRRRNRRG